MNRKHGEGFYKSVDPEQFKFCWELFGAVFSGRMPAPDPGKHTRIFEGELFRIGDNPTGRAMAAIVKHFNELDKPSEEASAECMATCYRILCAWDFRRAHEKDKRLSLFIKHDDKGRFSLSHRLIEALAVADIDDDGFVFESVIDALVSRVGRWSAPQRPNTGSTGSTTP